MDHSIVVIIGFEMTGSTSESKINNIKHNDYSDAGLMARMLKVLMSRGRLWRSKLSWRVAFAVFLTIMAVQAGILAVTVGDYEKNKLHQLEKFAKTAIIPILDAVGSDDIFSVPFEKAEIERIIAHTPVSGMAVYSLDFNLLAYYGEPTNIFINTTKDLDRVYYSENGKNYEVVLRPRDLDSKPYYMITRMDSSGVRQSVADYVMQAIFVMLSMSGFVTVVLMIALGEWLLEPIIFLQQNLKAASRSPENPNIEQSPFSKGDEVGDAIFMAQKLITQNAKNIHEIKNRAQDQIHKLAYFDPLTNLPNRTSFLDQLSEFKERESSTPYDSGIRSAIMTLDLDHFKDINDSMGHNVGDAILKAVGLRLRSSLPDTAFVARTGEDEFAVSIPLTGTMKTSKQAAEKVQKLIRMEPFSVFSEDFQVRASMGVSVFPDDGFEPDQVLKNAHIALNRAKEAGRDTFREYMEDFDQAVQARFQMLRDLRDAIETDKLSLNFQPQLNLKTGEVIGAEALIRWWKEDDSKEGGKWISPVEFIPIAEQSGLVVPIGEWVMKKACQTAKKWHDAGKEIRIAVNVSGVQFQQSDLVGFTKKVLKETQVKPHLLELEVTESAFMDDIDHTVEILNNLHALGVELAIDDFGTGYSSLSYLRQFPIDRLKIDQSFIKNALVEPDDASITSTIITLGHALNLKVIAEGVETIDHQKFLMHEGCDEVQGYRYSRPVPEDEFVAFTDSYSGSFDFFEK